MTHTTEPAVFCIGETKLNKDELQNYLQFIGAGDWTSDAPDDVSEIIEIDGRGCYMSFGTELNENITKVRESNKDYLENIIKVNHGAVLEHSFVNFQIVDVSRVFTHELVRHRVGVAISQESLRFVRVDDIGYWIPKCFTGLDDDLQAVIVDTFDTHFAWSETRYKGLLGVAGIKEFRLTTPGKLFPRGDALEYFNNLPFGLKKKYTSAARRLLPMGMATKIGWSCNIRALRHVLEMRTHPSAEEEIRFVFEKIGFMAQKRWPNLFNDYHVNKTDGYMQFLRK